MPSRQVSASRRMLSDLFSRALRSITNSCAARSSARSRCALAGAPLGVFLVLRRMSLAGDALGARHSARRRARLSRRRPVAAGHDPRRARAPASSSRWLAGAVARFTVLREDASLAAFYLVSLALGVTHRLAAAAPTSICCMCCSAMCWRSTMPRCCCSPAIATLTLFALALFYRPLVMDTLDPAFLRRGEPVRRVRRNSLFLALVVLNLVAGFHALGTLMAVGLIMLPAAAASLWTQRPRASRCRWRPAGRAGELCRAWSFPISPARRPARRSFWRRAWSISLSLVFGRAGGLMRLRRPRQHLEG